MYDTGNMIKSIVYRHHGYRLYTKQAHGHMIQSSRYRIQIKVQDTGYRVKDAGFTIPFRVQDTGYRVYKIQW